MKRKSSDHSHNRTSYRWFNLTTSCVVTVALVCAPMGTLLANPVDGVVSAGSASIASNGATTTITQGSDRAVIDWRGFDIAAGETTRFVQPAASSMTLNRVNSNSASFINGNLIANGNLIVVNPNGVWFGANARVDVNGLIASTADIDNAAFMNSTGELAFDKPGNPNGFVVNEGLITAKEAGLVGLVAPNVINSGVIAAKLGRVHLASGDTATVDMYGDGLIRVAVSDAVKSQLVENSGIIAVEGGTIAMTAAAGKDIVNSLVHVAGELHAPSISQKNGKIIIAAEGSNAVAGNVTAQKGKKSGSSNVVIEGTLNASGRKSAERGGSITVTGDNIALLDGTLIDASGSDGASGTTLNKAVSALRDGAAGGDIRIGGDYLGGGNTPTAQNLYVGSGALILNDALNSGDAGRTIFWSDGLTQFYGNVYARALGGKSVDGQTWNATAGGNTGDGGFVETSGHDHLDAGGYVDLTASNGARGTYFLDPTNITIYGNFAPNYATVIQGDSAALSANLKLWLDASDAANVTLTYSALTTAGANSCASSCLTANGTSGATTITTSANIASTLQVGQRIRLGSAGSVTAASTLGADTYTIASIAGTTITFTSALTTTYTTATVYGGYISQITDKSGNGKNATTGTEANMPLWISNGQNGLGVAYFNGSRRLDVTGVNMGSLSLSGSRANDNNNVWFETTNTGSNERGFSFQGPHSDVYYLNEVSYLNSALRAWGNYTGTTNTQLIFSAEDSNLATSVNFSIGYATPGFTRLIGTVNEFIDYGVVIPANTRNLIEQYQSAKWGVALTPPGSGATEVAQATASVQKGDAADGYSVFTTRYLERLAQSANISLQSSNNITLDLQGDTLNFATAGRSLTLTAGNQITTASTGGITTNNGAVSLYANDSIVFSNAFTINTNGGAILMNADRDASGVGAISLTGATINSGGGSITMGGGSGTISAGSGYATGNATNENGILVSGGSITAVGGNIIMNGQSRVTTTSFISGVSLDGAAAISTNNSGTINIYGLGNTGTGTSNRGVRIVNGSTVTAQNGNITINGTGGGSSTAANNYGVFLGGSGGYISTNGSGSINVTGTGGNTGGSGGVNYGVYITNAGSYIKTTNTGSITITGTKGGQSSSYGILTDIINAIVTSGSSGNITLTADSISLSGASGSNYNITSVASLTVAPLAAMTMGLGTGTGTFTFTTAQIGYTSAASYIFGSTAGGNLAVNTTKDFVNKNVSFISGGSITLSGNLTKATGTGTATYLFQANGAISNSGSAGVAASSGSINLTLNSNQGGGGGAITLTNAGLNVNGGTIALNSSGSAITQSGTIGGDETITSSNGGVSIGLFNGDSVGTRSLTVDAGTGTFTTTAAIGATNKLNNLTVTADDAVLGGNIAGAGTLAIKQSSSARPINVNYGVADGTNLNFSATEIGYFVDGWSAVNIGSSTVGDVINMGASTWVDPVVLSTNSGGIPINIRGAVTGTGNASFNTGTLQFYTGGSLTTNGQNITSIGNLYMNADTAITTNGGSLDIYYQGFFTIPSNLSIQTAGGNISLCSHCAGSGNGLSLNTSGHSAVLNAGSGSVTIGADMNGGNDLTIVADTINTYAGSIWGGSTALGNVSVTTTNSITPPSVTASSILIRTTGVAADVTLGSGKVLTANSAGTALTVSAGRSFINNAGSGALATPSGRWLVYSTSPASDSIGGLANSFRRFSCTYGGSCPSFPGTGNGFLYSATPTLTATPNSISSIVYGAAAPSLSGYAYTLSGYLGSDAAADVVTGSLTGSTSYIAGSNVGTYSINHGLGSLASALGYGFSYANNANAFSVTARPITVTANALTKTYGSVDPTLTYSVTSGSLFGSDTFTGTLQRVAGENIGSYGIAQGDLSAGGNYTLSFTGNNLSITPATLTVTADTIRKIYGFVDPALTYSVSGLANGDTPSVVTGSLSRIPGTAVGVYSILQNTIATTTNYFLRYVAGSFNIIEKDIPTTVTRVSQDPTLVMAMQSSPSASPANDSSPATTTPPTQSDRGNSGNTAASTAEPDPIVQTNFSQGWLKISPELAAMLGIQTGFAY